MTPIEQIAEAVLQGDGLLARSLVQDFVRSQPVLAEIPRPKTTNNHLLAMTASLVELLAQRLNQSAPAWTATIGPTDTRTFPVQAAQKMKRLRELCQQESPEPLRKRGFYAPPGYFEFA